MRIFRFLAVAICAATFVFASAAVSTLNADEAKYQQVSDVVYKKVGDREIKLNLFLPLKDGAPVKNAPLYIYLDSGCWYSGNPGDGGFWRWLGVLDRGCAIASVSHRPINEAPFPAPMEDVRAAVRFLRKNAEKYGLDPNNFTAGGYSSGGHLSLTLGTSDAKSVYEVGDNLDVSGQVQHVVEFYGPTDFPLVFDRISRQAVDCIYVAFNVKKEDADDLTSPIRADLMERAKKYSPLHAVDADCAPTLILHGTDDTIVPLSQSALLFDELRKAGVRTKLIVGNGGVHDGSTVALPQEFRREVAEFLGW